MEIDQAVILFDEIDELVREREIEPDQFGRFLTTSMLPRLAELWTARKVMYFVATNHIDYFDRAVTRSERFDAIIFLSPPTFESKREQILTILRTKYSIDAEFDVGITKDRIDAAFPKAECKEADQTSDEKARNAAKAAPLPPASAICKFALIRWDELDNVALNLLGLLGEKSIITDKILAGSLAQLKDAKVRSLGEYCRFASDPESYERYDGSKNALWIVTEIDGLDLSRDELPTPVTREFGRIAVEAAIGGYQQVRVKGFIPELLPSSDGKKSLGRIRLKRDPGSPGRAEP